MVTFTGFELTMLVVAGIGWAGLFHYKGRKEAAEFFIHKVIEDKEVRDKVFAEFDAEKARVGHGR